MWCSTTMLLVLGYVTAQEYTEDKYSSKIGHLKEIPRRFEVKGKNSKDMFSKYANDIQKIAKENNYTVLYKIKVDVSKPLKKKKTLKKITFKKIKTKKFNVPLKKQSMKLSNFEILLRKIAEENGAKNKIMEIQDHYTTETVLVPQFYNNKQLKIVKFKPVLGRIKTNFTKFVKPVRNKVITLSS